MNVQFLIVLFLCSIVSSYEIIELIKNQTDTDPVCQDCLQFNVDLKNSINNSYKLKLITLSIQKLCGYTAIVAYPVCKIVFNERTVKKIINKIDAIEVCKIMYFCDKNDKDLILPEVRKDPKDVCHDCTEFYGDVKILAEMNVGKLERGIEKGCNYITL